MEITHTDRNGTRWAFSINCTPYQAEMLRNTLHSLGNIGGREQLTMRYYQNYKANEEFCLSIERFILASFSSAFPYIPNPENTYPLNGRY